jgi:hypothetical protein
VIRDGEVIRWRGHDLACDWMPGQTEFACCVHGVIDGKRVAFTGDNIFGSPADPAQHGHEAVVARNSCTIDEGYGFAGKYLHGIAPDLILASPTKTSPFVNGAVQFVEDREGPPSRAYLKLWEVLTRFGAWPQPGFKKAANADAQLGPCRLRLGSSDSRPLA